MGTKTVLNVKFDDKKLREILKKIPNVEMRIGWNKNQREENGMLTWQVAYLNEVGHYIHHKNGNTTHVVARPFLGLSQEMYGKHWLNSWHRYFKQYLVEKYQSIRTIANKLCLLVIADIQHLVEVEKPFAPNAPLTVARKKAKGLAYKTPLVAYGTMIDKLIHEVHIKKGK